QRGHQRDEHDHGEGGDVGNGEGDERQEVGEAGDGLRAVLQRVDDHAGGDGEQQDGGNESVVEDFGGGDGIHRIDGGGERGPSAAEQAVGEGAVFFAALEHHAGDEHGEAGAQAKCDTPSGAELRVGVVEQQGNADDGDENADFVDPIAADEGLPFFAGAVHRLRRGLERPHEHIGQRRNRSGRRGGRLRRLHDGRRDAEVRRRGVRTLHNRRRGGDRADGGIGVSPFENRDTTFQSVDAVAQISPTNAVIHGSAPYFRLTIPFYECVCGVEQGTGREACPTSSCARFFTPRRSSLPVPSWGRASSG